MRRKPCNSFFYGQHGLQHGSRTMTMMTSCNMEAILQLVGGTRHAVLQCTSLPSSDFVNHSYDYRLNWTPLVLLPLLKGHCHEDLAVLGQFCAKMKISNEFYQRGLTIINFLRMFGTRSIKTRKTGQFFQVSIHFHPCIP